MPGIVSRVRSKVKHQLRKLRRKTADKGLAMRCQIVLLWAEGEGPGAIAQGVGCSPSWVGRVVGRFRDHGVAGLHDRREDNGQVKLDEVDVHLNPKIGPDWMNRGKQKQVPTPGTNAKRYVCGALDVATGRLTCVAGESKTSQLFICTLERLLRANPKATAIHVVLDNFKIHSSKQVQAWLADRGERIKLHFLPPYCPDQNRIERLWRDPHADVTRNHRHRTIEPLMAAVWQWIENRNRAAGKAQRRRAA